MSLIYDYLGAILKVIDLYKDCITVYGDKFRIVSYYPPTPDRSDIQLNCADRSCIVIYADQSISGFGPSRDPDGELADMGEPQPWPFDFLEAEVKS